MNHKVVILVVATLLLSCTPSKSFNDRDRSAFDLKGNVKEVIEKMYSVTKQNGKYIPNLEEGWVNTPIGFNKEGMLITFDGATIKYDANGKFLSSTSGATTLKRNDLGQIIEYELGSNKDGYYDRSDGKEHLWADPGKFVWEYDKATGKLIMCDMSGDGAATTVEYKYDKENNIAAQIIPYTEMEMGEDSRFEYLEFDKQGNWTKRLCYSKELAENYEYKETYNPSEYKLLYIEMREITYYE